MDNGEAKTNALDEVMARLRPEEDPQQQWPGGVPPVNA